MLRKVFKFFIHPLLIYVVIAILECIPYYPNAPKIALHEMPKIGDNFTLKNSQTIYYYSGKGKYAYPSVDCYFSLGNPSFDVGYKEGGLKTIDKEIADKIPFLGTMCDPENDVNTSNSILNRSVISTNFLLEYFSGVSHILSYCFLSIATLYFLRKRKNKYRITFLSTFFAGGLLELVQEFFILGRSASIEDMRSNGLGIILALILYSAVSKIITLDSIPSVNKKPD